MSKFCPVIDCDFWNDWPEGIPKGRFCSYCGKELTEINPKEIDETIQSDTIYERKVEKGSHGTEHIFQESIKPLNTRHPSIRTEIDENENNVVRIRFNTLIRRKYYEKIDAICLRIGHKYFQDFKTSIVPFEESNSVQIHGVEFVTIHGTLVFPTRKVNRICFSYKYYYYLKSGEERYEHLHHESNINYNRYFIWDTVNTPINSLCNNTYQHFDMMILPERSRGRSIHGLMSRNNYNVTSYAKTDTNIPFYNIGERILVSFAALLPSSYGCGYSYPLRDLEDFLYQFQYIVHILCHAKLRDPEFVKLILCDNSVLNAKQCCSILTQSWMMWCYTVEENISLDDTTILNKFYLGCILLHKYNIRRNELDSRLIIMVEKSIKSILSNKKLFDSTPATTPTLKGRIQSSVQNFIFNTIKSSCYPKTILTIIPIYHMVNNLQNEANSLHKELEYTQNKYWGFPSNNSVIYRIHFEYKELQLPLSLVKYDTILPYTIVVQALNETNAQKLCNYYIQNSQYCPLSALIGTLLFRLNSSSSSSCILDDHLRSIMLESLVNGFTEDAEFNLDDISRLNSLTITFALKLTSEYFNYEQFRLCLTLLSKTCGYCKKYDPQWNIPTETLTKFFKEFVVSWYASNIIKMDASYQDHQNELNFWEDMISGYSFSLRWRNNVEEYLNKRFTNNTITDKYLTDLMIDLHTKYPSRNVLKAIVINQLISLLKGISSKQRNLLVKRLYQVFSEMNQLKIVGEIINQVLMIEKGNYEDFPQSIHFINWGSWDLYFTLLMAKKDDNILSNDVKDIVLNAIHPHFASLLDEIASLSIPLHILEIIHKNKEYFTNLVKIFQELDCVSDGMQENVNQHLDLCLDMFKWYLVQKKLFNNFLAFLGIMQNININCIEDFLAMKCHQRRTHEIIWQEHMKIRFSANFMAENPFMQQIYQNYDKFEPICNICPLLLQSSIVVHIFRDFSNRIVILEKYFDFMIFYEHIWDPTFDICEAVFQSICDQTIFLSKIRVYFDGLTKLHSIENEIFQLYSVIQQYKNLKHPDKLNSTMKDVANKIHIFIGSERYFRSAHVISELKVMFKITSKFDTIDSIIDMEPTQSDKKLSELYTTHPNSISSIAKKLSSLNLEVINAVISNSTLITWIRDNMADLDEVKAFVDVSLTTCGGDPVEIDRITGLSSVCTNLAPLIFETNKNTSCDKLLTECSQITNNAEKTINLIKLLEQAGMNVKFWDELKRSHGAVEETTLMQFDNIIQNGTFNLKVGGSCKLNEMISLSINRGKEESKGYTLEELKEFRSKLMLVIRKKSENYQNCQDFDHTLNIMAEIGKTVIQLSESGNQEYLTYLSEMTEQNLMGIKDILNSILEEWRKSIEKARLSHHYLNYFTITQIVYLQKGIKSFLNEIKHPYQFYHLLRLLNHNVTKKDVLQALPQHQTVKSSLNKKERKIIDKVSKIDELPLTAITDTVREMKRDKNYIISKKSIMFCYNRYIFEKSTVNTEYLQSEPSFLQLKITSTKEGLLESYMTFDELGIFLHEISKSSSHKVMVKQTLPKGMRDGKPNLVVIPSHSVFEFVLSLYIIDKDEFSLPLYHEVLFCTDQTTIEDVDIFWIRAMRKIESNDQSIFCMVNIQNLNYQVAVEAFSTYKKRSDNWVPKTYKIVLICSEGKETYSYLATAFEDFKRSVVEQNISKALRNQLIQKFSNPHKTTTSKGRQCAWVVDSEMSRVRIVFSNSAGAGKSLHIQNLKSEMLKQSVVNKDELGQAVVTVAIHGKAVSEDYLTEQLLSKNTVKHGVIFHLDIASTIQTGIEILIFKFLILGGVCKNTGEFWHNRLHDYLVIEITLPSDQNTQTQCVQLFPTIQCFQPSDAIRITGNINTQTIDLQTFRKEQFQRVNSYLMRYETGDDLDKFVFQSLQSHQVDNVENLKRLLKHCEVVDPSWAELQNFTHFLNKQLSDCDNSFYCRSGLMGDEWRGFKSFVVKFMLYMSRNFATSSLCKYSEQEITDLTNFSILEERRWEKTSHPYIFFNPDGHTMTFLGFHISQEGNLIDPDNPHIIIKTDIMHPELFPILELNKVFFQQNYHQLNKLERISKITGVMNIELLVDPDPGYVLTLDNTKKILAILMRFRCNIPVVIMGETGCGKTRLIQFMCSLQALPTGAKNMLILKVHGGTTERDVMCEVEEAEKLATLNFHNHNIDTVLFFDEANTSPAIGLIKEIMCDRRMYGRHISNDIRLQFIAACNPYRRHTKEMLHKLSTAGLGFFTKSTDTTDRLGDIPLRELVYRVIELPASMRPLVWDFGQLSNDVEKTYTREMVAKHLREKNSPIEASDDVIDAISEVLAGAQNYMRERKDECSFVSLRDVERAMRVMLWFYSNIRHFRPKQDIVPMQKNTPAPLLNDRHVEIDARFDIDDSFDIDVTSDIDDNMHQMEPIDYIESLVLEENYLLNSFSHETSEHRSYIHGIDYLSYSLILSLAICYRARLQERDEFDICMIHLFRYPLTQIDDHTVIYNEVNRCQQIIIDEMILGPNIAKNSALRENVFMMFVCIELKIPLFVIGKPGSSKSLAKSIISNSMQGIRCPDGSILQNFKQIQIMSYQCSQLSTADGIIGIFNTCRNIQHKTGSDVLTACVVLEEVGLAEDSPLLPLKVLHPLLEDSSYGYKDIKDKKQEISKNFISVDENENRVAFIGISNWSLDPAKMNRGIMVTRGDPDLNELIVSAQGISKSTTTNSLSDEMKQVHNSIYRIIPSLATSYNILSRNQQVDTHLGNSGYYFGLRDFYSLIKMLIFICSEMRKCINFPILQHVVMRNFGGISNIDAVTVFVDNLKLSVYDVEGPDSSPLGLVKANLTNLSRSFHGETRYLLLISENYAALNILLYSPDMWPKPNDLGNIRVMFGSNFPNDQEYSTVCRDINKIKLYMESGKTIILLDLENLYESLYDALNQYYMFLNNQRYVDLGLGTQRMKCRIHDDFKLIVVADSDTVRKRFPLPLINRLEKHFIDMSTGLTEEGNRISEMLAKWAVDFSSLDHDKLKTFHNYTLEGCFIGFKDNTPSSIVFHVIKVIPPIPTNEEFNAIVLEESKKTLLKMATIDAVLRLKSSKLHTEAKVIMSEYFKFKLCTLQDYLRHTLKVTSCTNELGAHLTLATTHSSFLTGKEVEKLKETLCTRVNIQLISLHQFQTEYQYTREIQMFLSEEPGKGSNKKILLVQCERGAYNAKLIACARHKMEDELKDWKEENNKFEIFVVFLVLLNRHSHENKFASYCGGYWNTVHIDDICALEQELLPVSSLIGKKIHQIFEGDNKEFNTYQTNILNNCIQRATSLLDDQEGNENKIYDRISCLESIMAKEKYSRIFTKVFWQRIKNLLLQQTYNSDVNSDWLQETAHCIESIQTSGTFLKAVTHRINNIIAPLLAELIASVDRNGNLMLSLVNNKTIKCLSDLWVKIFQDERVFVLRYEDTISPETLSPRARVPVLNNGAGGKYFKASFPFSWIIDQCSFQILAESKKLATTHGNLWDEFESLFDKTPLGVRISEHLGSHSKYHEIIPLYMEDFIHMNLNPINDAHYEVCMNVLSTCIHMKGVTDQIDDKISIPRIYCAYEDSKPLLELFRDAFLLDSKLPGKMLYNLMKTKDGDKSRCLEFLLLEEITSMCVHYQERTVVEELAKKYVNEVNQWQPIVEKVLHFTPDVEGIKTIRLRWNRIVAVKLFITHCAIGNWYKQIQSKIHKFYTLLGDCPDFTTAESINLILKVLSSSLKKVKKGSGMNALNIEEFKNNATRFFTIFLTTFIFNCLQIENLDKKLTDLIMGLVTSRENSTRSEKESMSIFTNDEFNPSSAFRAYLLHLLIKQRNDVFKKYFSEQLTKEVLQVKIRDQTIKGELNILIIHSIEDNLHGEFYNEPCEKQLDFISTKIATLNYSQKEISYEMLENVAVLRFICVYISKWIIEIFVRNRQTEQLVDQDTKKKKIIIDFKEKCPREGYECVRLFLFKNIYHHIGSDTSKMLTSNDCCSWMVPDCVSEKIEMPDFFLIYKGYQRVMDVLAQVIKLQNKDPLLKLFNLGYVNPMDAEYLMYSMFQQVVTEQQQSGETQILHMEKYINIKEFMDKDLQTTSISPELKDLATQIMTNNLGDGHLKNLKLSNKSSNNEIFLIRLIYHVAVMLSSKRYHRLFLPIALIYENPQNLNGKLFPTMIDDPLVLAIAAFEESGRWYKCPKGHPYFIGNCGGAVTSYTCIDCGGKIGGNNYKLQKRNAVLEEIQGNNEIGYLLGEVNHESLPTGVRSLSAVSVKIIRVMMDISFIWSFCTKSSTNKNTLSSLIIGGLNNAKNIPDFFCQHLVKDLRDLSNLTGEKFEDVIFTLHLIIKLVMEKGEEIYGTQTDLRHSTIREKWESEFDKNFIQPITNSLHTNIQTQKDPLLNEERIANNPVLRIVEERDVPDPNNPLPHLWRYRTIVSLEHFSQSFSTAGDKIKVKCPLVDKFLREENKLSVARYLPDIVQLQKRMREKFLHRLDRREVSETNIKSFLDKIKRENIEDSDELRRLVNSFSEAWNIIGEDVKKNGRLTMDKALELHEITPATPLAYLLSSSTGEGALLTSLTDYLVMIHNSFVHAYRSMVSWSRSDKIPLCELVTSHVMDYKEHLQPLLLSHAHYSLALGEGSQVTYDFEGVEQQFIEQFIQSKPLIVAEHLRFEYAHETYSQNVFKMVRLKVKQTELSETSWRVILKELGTVEAVNDVLLVLDVVIGFLSSAGGDPEQKLTSYLQDVLKYSQTTHGADHLPGKRAEGVCLKHILNFWTLLSIEKARKLSINGQIPFSFLKEEFHEDVSEVEETQIKEWCIKFSANKISKILTYLHEFIVFFVQGRDVVEKKYGLRDCILIHAENEDWKPPEEFNQFPEETQLSQCASTWAVLVVQEHNIL